MRAMFGLVALLVCVGVVMWVFSLTSIPTAREGKKAQDQARQISGRGENGQAATDSFKVTPQMKGNSRLGSLLVTDVTPGGAMDQYYGLKKGDEIIEITTQGGMTKVGDASNDDAEMAKDKVQEAFQASGPIVVMRGGRAITLPLPAGSTAAAPANSASANQNNAATAQPARQPQRTNIYDQVNGITKGLQGQGGQGGGQ